MPNAVLAVTEAGMLNDVQRLHSISHNLANVSTVGFKREIALARPFIEQLQSIAGLSTRGEARPVAATWVDHSDGALKNTGNPLDLALEGNGFFVVATPAGETYTRQGNFRLDVNGRLATAHGHPVLGEGGEIQLTGPTPRIDTQGNVWEGTEQVARLKLVGVTDPRSLISLGEGLYRASDGTALAVDAPRVRQGFLETANVVAMKEMIHMIETVRHFEAAQRLIRGYDSMLDRAINQAGELS